LIKLVKLAKKGDKPAFDEIIRLCVPEMFRIAMSILNNKDDADDAVCETVLKAYENLHTLNNSKIFRTWIIRILINQANDIYKSRNKVLYLHDYDAVNEPRMQYDEYNLGSDELSVAVAGLSVEFRTVITLFYFQDLRIREIADVLQIPQGTVKWRLSKAKERLREKLTEAPSPELKGRIEKCKVM